MNRVTLIGNISQEPELKQTDSGRSVCEFTIAANERYRDSDGEWQQGRTDFVPVTAWGTLGENVYHSLAKGDRVIVTGRMQLRSWKNTDDDGNEDGTFGNATDVVAEGIGLELTFTKAAVLEEVQ